MTSKWEVSSLQQQCCQAISLNCEYFPEAFLDELNQPCLSALVDHLSMFDLLRLEHVLQGRGMDTKSAMYRLQQILFINNETYPIKSTTCPHLLDLFPCDGWEWGLSRLLYRRAIVQLIEEYDKHSNLPKDIQGQLVDVHSYLLDLFCPTQTIHREKVKEKVQNSEDMVLTLAALAARHILFITANDKQCKFLLDKRFGAILDGFCESLLVISLILKSSPTLLDLVKVLKNRGKKLERVCINVIRTSDLQYFDAILSTCSGVVSYYLTAEGQREKEALDAVVSECPDESSAAADTSQPIHDFDREVQSSVPHCTKRSEFKSSEFDLMDDAVLFGTLNSSTQFDTYCGMQKADFKFTNLVDKNLYVPVLDHHLQSWLSIRELHLGVPDLHPKLLRGICSLLQRNQFKSLTLSSADFSPQVLDDILTTVAQHRHKNPLDKLMFVSMQERLENMEDHLVTDHLSGKSDEEMMMFVKQFESTRIAETTEFQGTRLLEVYLCSLGVKSECLLLGYVVRDVALTSLCFSNSVSRLFVQLHLKYLTLKERQLSTLILEEWQILGTSSCQVLSNFLTSVSSSLQNLSLRGCLNFSGSDKFKGILEMISNCKNLRSLDLSENHLGENCLPYVIKILANTQIRELALRKNGLSMSTILQLLTEISHPRNHSLDTLDLRRNAFWESQRQQYRDLIKSATRYLLIDHGPSSADNT